MGLLFWLWAWNTSDKLKQNNNLQEQNNQLLEQIRRLQLSPAQRAREDALRAAEAQLTAEEQKKSDKLALWALGLSTSFFVAFPFIIGPISWIINHW